MNPELDRQLRRQLLFLRRSAQGYDEGIREEAIRIAVALRVLFHDTGTSHSLLGQMGLKESLPLLTTIENAYQPIPGTDRARVSITPMISPESGFVVPLDKSERSELVGWKTWWTQAVLWRGSPLSRGEIVLSAVNQDGGAHVDPHPKSGILLLREGVGSYQPPAATAPLPLDNVHFPLLRQFAYEVLHSPAFRSR